jgi:hypothetical protein
MSGPRVAKALDTPHHGASAALGGPRRTLFGAAFPLPSPTSTRARARAGRRRAAMAVSGAPRFGRAPEAPTILVCYDRSPLGRRSSVRAGCCPESELSSSMYGARQQDWRCSHSPGRGRTAFRIGFRRLPTLRPRASSLPRWRGLIRWERRPTAWSKGPGDRSCLRPTSSMRSSSSSGLAVSQACERLPTAPYPNASFGTLTGPYSWCLTVSRRLLRVGGRRTRRVRTDGERLRDLKGE